MNLVKLEQDFGSEFMVNPNFVRSIIRHSKDTVCVFVSNKDTPYIVKGTVEEVSKKLTESSKVDSIAGLMVIVFIGIYILSTLANLLSQ